MQILLKNIRLAHDPSQRLHSLLVDVELGVLASIGSEKGAEQVFNFEGRNVFATPGWIDLRAFCGEPGNERSQTLTALASNAVLGGYGQVLLHPHHPGQFDNEAEIARISNLLGPVQFSVAAPLSEGLKGKKLRELLHFQQSGAKAFSDGYLPEGEPAFYAQALQYSRNLAMPVFVRPDVQAMSQNAQAYEGDVSARTGLSAASRNLEMSSVRQYLELNNTIGGGLHLTGLTDPAAVKAIEATKATGTNISYDISAIHLVHDEQEYEKFDSAYKVYSFLREKSDVEELRALVKQYLPPISSSHFPNTPEAKDTDFTHAEFGARTLHLAPWSVIRACSLTAQEAYQCFHAGPAALLGQLPLTLDAGINLDLTVFDMDDEGPAAILGSNTSETTPLLLRFYRNTMFTPTPLLT